VASPVPKRPLLVSACLLGVACNHRGANGTSAPVAALSDRWRLVPVCPEVAGGLPTPRPAAELQPDGTVRTEAGEDVTSFYRRGAVATVALARALGATGAVLKSRSPSCGCHQLYDGTFRRMLVDGEGVTARALREAGVEVCSDEDVATGTHPSPEPGA